MNANSLEALDRRHWIHPVASWSEHEERGPTILAAGRGAYLTDSEGRELVDGFSGLWCVNVGYGQESVIEAALQQMRRLPYATGYFGFASEPAILLAARLAALTPGDLDHIFFTLGGSDAVDTALRFIRYYFNVTGRPDKKQIISLERGYHGSSSQGAGVTSLPVFHAQFDLPTPEQHRIASPYPYRNPVGADGETIIAASTAALRAKVAEIGADKVAAFFCEPVQGSGGVIVPPPGWLRAMRETARDLDILFIADEVITGFGRTGPMFACEAEDVVPDMLTMAKGLTCGYAPMGALAISEPIYRAIADATPRGTPVGHGFTYSGHPVSAAVALAILDLYTQGGLLQQGQAAGERLDARLSELAAHPLVGEVRSRGLLAGIEIVADKASKTRFSREARVAEKLTARSRENRVIFRAFADDIIGLAPALCCTGGDIDLIVERVRRCLDDMLDLREIRAELR